VFVSLAQNYVNAMRWEAFPEIMRSDFEALEPIQSLMDALPAEQTPQVDTPGDLSVLKAREILARMLATEAGTP
jgi:hypothetical protein